MSEPAERPRAGVDDLRRAWSVMCDLVLNNERRREVGESLGMSFGRTKALRRIARSPMTMGEVAAELGIDRTYATVVIDELERRRLVERRPHPTDRRVKLVTATRRGAAAAARADQILGRPPAGLADLPESDLAELARILTAVEPHSRARSASGSGAATGRVAGRR